MRSRLSQLTKAGHPYVVAMVLGTALTAMNAGPGVAAEVSSERSQRTINDLSRYCTACWRNARLPPDSWQDCTQEVFRRLMERVQPDGWNRLLRHDGDEHREFIRAIDAVKKRTQRGRHHSSFGIESVADRHDGQNRRMADEREAVRRASAEVLSERQREVIRLSFEGWSVHEIAERLSVGPERVSDEKYKAIRKLRERLCDTPESEA
jgi:RNA polymerase sigma factor (sigma-70 family)